MTEKTNTSPLKVLFVCSGNKSDKCSAAVRGQAINLEKNGIKVFYHQIKGKGLVGYLQSALQLRRHLKNNTYYIIHAHYGLSAIAASIAGASPLVVSLMGSDVLGSSLTRLGMKIFTRYWWPAVIVKSDEMAHIIGKNRVFVVPNGVDLSIYKEIPREKSRQKAGIGSPKVVLWPANPARKVKNIELAQNAMKALKRKDCELKIVSGQPMDKMPIYYNASDVVLITSRWEGSSNVVKEALACNIPVVSTPVGDVYKWLSKTKGCKICDPKPGAIAAGLEYALSFSKRTNGREIINELNHKNVTKKILDIYAKSIFNFRQSKEKNTVPGEMQLN